MAYLGNSPGVSSQRVATTFTATAGQTAFNPVGGYTLGYTDVYLNGVKLIDGVDFTAADGVTITLVAGAALNDNLETLCYTPHGLSDGYTKPEADARYQATSNGSIDVTGTVTAAAGIFTTADINAGTIDGTTIGGTTAAAGSFTTGAFSETTFVGLTARPAGVPATAGRLWAAQNETGNYGIASKASTTDSFTYIGNTGTKATLGQSYGSTGSYLPLVLQTSDIDRLTISAAGAATFSGAVDMASTLAVATRVGIGVAAHASAALNITTTDQHIRLNNGSEIAVIELDSDGELNIWAHGDGETINLKTGSGAGTDVLSVVGSNVGIGTSSPSAPLDIKLAGTGTADIFKFQRSDGLVAGVLNYNGTDGAISLGTTTAHPLAFDTNNVERMRLDSSGDLNLVNTGLASLNFTTDGSLDYARITGGKSGSGIGELQFWTYSGGISRAATIDAIGNLLVGTTTTNIATEGIVLYGSGNKGVMTLSSTAKTALYVNRSNDGELVQFRQGGGATVGSIGANGGTTYFAGPNANTGGFRIDSSGSNGAIVPTTNTGANRDAATDLGYSSGGTNIRFKDLYLSGGVVFGTTGGSVSSKTLDDYEEGTWTPVLSKSTTAPSVTYTAQLGAYTKVGRLVFVSGRLAWSAISGGTGEFRIADLPFTILNSTSAYSQMTSIDYGGVTFGANDTTFGGYGAINGTYIVLIASKNNATNSTAISGLETSGFMYFNLTYQAA